MVRSVTGATIPPTVKQNIRTRLENRTESVFVAEERQGLMLAAKTRTIALVVILLWQVADNPHAGLAYVFDLSVFATFTVLGLVQYV